MRKLNYIALITAAGNSERFDSGKNSKLLSTVLGKPVLYYCLRTFIEHDKISEIYLTTRPQDVNQFAEVLQSLPNDKPIFIVEGGQSRQESVTKALSIIAKNVTLEFDNYILVHDAARPALPASSVDEITKEIAARHSAVALARPVTDTLRRVPPFGDGRPSTLNRDEYCLMQTPQVAKLEYLLAAMAEARSKKVEYTDEIAALEACGFPYRLLMGPQCNFKLTHREDLKLLEFYLRQQMSDEI
ncbi:MAG: 2-C-methyl-D-erythritol 4-phosphate cytidylyltransferase [Eubacteriales bacterium]|nr:2-C-methyl-D-erythritol 4-phosphate cytidylyltransferase [Eubacteriales bacterium]